MFSKPRPGVSSLQESTSYKKKIKLKLKGEKTNMNQKKARIVILLSKYTWK